MNVAAIKRLAAVIMIHLKHGPGDFGNTKKMSNGGSSP